VIKIAVDDKVVVHENRPLLVGDRDFAPVLHVVLSDDIVDNLLVVEDSQSTLTMKHFASGKVDRSILQTEGESERGERERENTSGGGGGSWAASVECESEPKSCGKEEFL
jgi:hypothetical protein